MSSSSRRNSQEPRPESPLSDRSPRHRDASIPRKKVAEAPLHPLSPKTPLPLPGSSEVPKRPRRYSTEKVTEFRLEEEHRPNDKVIHVDLEDIENDVRGGTPSSMVSVPANGSSLLNDSLISHDGPRTSTPRKSSRKSRRAPDSLYKRVLMKSASRTAVPPDQGRTPADSSMDSYRTAQESMVNSTMSPIRIETEGYRNQEEGGYRSANSTQRALFSQQGAAPLARRASRSASRSRLSSTRVRASSSSMLCQLVTPLVVHTSQEVNAVSVTGQVLFISQTLVRSAHASSDVRKLMNHLAGKQPLISNEMTQVDVDHDNEYGKHEVFVGSDAILIQRVSTIHRGRDRNSFETDDRRTYRFVCQGDLLPEDRRDKQNKPRHLTIIAESATTKDCEEIEKSERVCLIFDAAEQPQRVLAPMPPETSLTHAANDLTSKPSALKDSPVSFEEHVRVSDHSHINIVRKARVNSCPRLWDEPLTELKEQRVYRQQLTEEAACEPVRITRSHSMSRVPARDRSRSASRRPTPQTPSRVERGRTPGRSTMNSSVLRPLAHSPLANDRSRHHLLGPDCTPSVPRTTDLITCISPIRDEPARREELPRRRNASFDVDDTTRDSVSLPARTSPDPKTLLQQTLPFSEPTPSPATGLQLTPRTPLHTSRSASRSPAKFLHTTPTSQQPQHQWQTPRTARPPTAEDGSQKRSMRSPSLEEQQFTPLRTARQQSPARPVVVIDEDTSAGSSQSPTQNRTPTTVSPRRHRLTTAVYQSPADMTGTPRRRSRTPSSRDPATAEWERMLDATQPPSPMASPHSGGRRRSIPADCLPASAPAASDSRLARPAAAKTGRPGPPASLRAGPSPLRAARSWHSNLDAVAMPRPRLQQQMQPWRRQPPSGARRALSEHSVFQTPSPTAAATPSPLPPAPANSAIVIASPYRGRGYVRAAEAPPVPRPRTTRPSPARAEPSSDPTSNEPTSAVAVSASATATRRQPASAPPATRQREASAPRTATGRPTRADKPSSAQQNVELVQNPEDYEEGEILKKQLTLEAKINGHLWNLSVVFALKADRADLVRFAPKRVRIDDQTLWEETENWSQTSLTPVTGPRTVARGSNSYEQVLLQPVAPGSLPQPGNATASTQTTPSVVQYQSEVRVAPRTPKNIATASTASSASSSRRSANKTKKSASKRSGSKSGDKKNNGTPFI